MKRPKRKNEALRLGSSERNTERPDFILRPRKYRIVLGVTGTFGSGKSTVARILRDRGALIIDADQLSRRFLRPGSVVYDKIIKAFGRDIVAEKGRICRRRLGRIVFADKKRLNELNRIMHPEIIRLIKKQVSTVKKGLVVLDAPLLVEAGLKNLADKLIVVSVSQANQIKRLRKKSSLTKLQIMQRIKAQIPLRVKKRLADFIIDNNGTLKQTKEQVERVLRSLPR